MVLKAREPWPRTGAVYCHPADGEWPSRTPSWSSGSRSAPAGAAAAPSTWSSTGRASTAPSWCSPGSGAGRSSSGSRPGPPGRPGRGCGSPAAGRPASTELTILVDTRERYPWRFGRQQAVSTERRALPAGDYAVEAPGGDGLAAVVERKTLADLAGSLVDGSLNYLLAELAAMPRAAVVVEDRYAGVFKLEHVPAGFVADLLGALAVRYPAVPVVFCDTRPLAQEWAYRFLGAAVGSRQTVRPSLESQGLGGEVEVLLVAEGDAEAAGGLDHLVVGRDGADLAGAVSAMETVEISAPLLTTTSP